MAHYRSRATGFGWRAARAAARRARALRRRGPEISVIVPFYNVEEYLAECLDSIVAQTYGDFEVLLVDDGSPDGSRRIAEEYVAADDRFRLTTRENGGLGAARNTGVREARGRYLTFVDSDDLLPPAALGVLVGSAHGTGSDIVVGSVDRFDSRRTWTPSWVDEVHRGARSQVTVAEFLPLLRNLYTWNKLYRRDFWDAQGLWFREGVVYEDQPIVTQLLSRARSIDIVPDVVYRYRLREDHSSISQQTSTIKDLRGRIAAWEASWEKFREELTPDVYQGWLQTLFEAHFQWYLTSPGTVDDTYWEELRAAVVRLADEASPWVWEATPPAQRVTVRLTQLGRRADLQEFVRRNGAKTDLWPATVTQQGVLLHLPFHGDPELDNALFTLRPEQLRVTHAVENVHWISRDDGSQGCWISGWAYLSKIDLSKHDSTIEVQLRHSRSGEVRSFPSTSTPPASFPVPRDDAWCDYSPGRFGVEIPLEGLGSGDREDDEWTVWLRVETAGFVAEQPVTRLIRSGAAGVIPAIPLGGGTRLVAEWQYPQTLRFRIARGGVVLTGLALQDRTVSGMVRAEDVTRVGRLTASAGGHQVTASWTSPPTGGRSFAIELPSAPEPDPGTSLTWVLKAWSTRGDRLDVMSSPGALQSPDAGSLVLETNRVGGVVVTEWSLGAVADTVTVSPAGVMTVNGRMLGPASPPVQLATRNKRERVFGELVEVVDGHFTASLSLQRRRYRFGMLPISLGDHDMSVRVRRPDGTTEEVPLLVSAALGSELPLPVRTEDLEARVIRGAAATVRLSVQRPLGEGRGLYHQNQLRTQGGGGRKLVHGVLMRSYFGESATDNGVSIQKELRRRGSDLPVYWSVQDKSIPVPEGGVPVVVNTPEWYELMFSARYYIDNMYQPEWHRKPEGQVLVQTFHGYPFKQMGHPHWRNLQFSQARIEAYDARAAQWDFLVSPARYATPLLTQAFNYPGQVLEIGYPRNDVLHSPEAADIRLATRDSLGIEEGQTAVLYAPTFRDYLASNDKRAVMADFFDFAEATRRLGDEYVLLVRGHAFNARSDQRMARMRGCIEVTDYPEVSDLYLAADAAIVDYSSLRFDFGVTGKPMLFHVPDLQRYKDTRGWLFDFEPTAPGPLLDTTAEVVDRLLDLEAVRQEHADQYAAFVRDFLDLEDGRAGERFVDAVFAPRGDA